MIISKLKKEITSSDYIFKDVVVCGKKVNLSTVNIKDLSDIIGQYVGSYQPSWSTNEKKTYGTKVLRAYNYLYSKKALS